MGAVQRLWRDIAADEALWRKLLVSDYLCGHDGDDGEAAGVAVAPVTLDGTPVDTYR